MRHALGRESPHDWLSARAPKGSRQSRRVLVAAREGEGDQLRAGRAPQALRDGCFRGAPHPGACWCRVFAWAVMGFTARGARSDRASMVSPPDTLRWSIGCVPWPARFKR